MSDVPEIISAEYPTLGTAPGSTRWANIGNVDQAHIQAELEAASSGDSEQRAAILEKLAGELEQELEATLEPGPDRPIPAI